VALCILYEVHISIYEGIARHCILDQVLLPSASDSALRVQLFTDVELLLPAHGLDTCMMEGSPRGQVSYMLLLLQVFSFAVLEIVLCLYEVSTDSTLGNTHPGTGSSL